MHVETICPGCKRKLRVPAEHAGATARCPICNTIYTVPEATASSEPLDPHERWRLKVPEGHEFGPVSRATLDAWVSEGRVSADCQLLCDAEGQWRKADDIYSVLRPIPVKVPESVAADSVGFGSSEPFPQQARGRILNPDRGGIVLALGILSWAVGCPIFGVLAWVMGSNDLHEMRIGTMDPRGQGMTEAGRIIGMLHALITLAVLVFGVFLLLFWGFLSF